MMAAVAVGCGHQGKGQAGPAEGADSVEVQTTADSMAVQVVTADDADDDGEETNEGYMRMIYAIEEFDDDIYVYRKQAEWHQRTERMLVHAFDSVHPGTRLAAEVKADSMLAELEAYEEDHAELTTRGMLYSSGRWRNFLIYRIATESKKVLDAHPAFSKELQAWGRLHQSLAHFCLSIVRLEWWGGSGAGPAIGYMSGEICRIRLGDLKRIRQHGQGAKAGTLDDAVKSFRRRVETAARSEKERAGTIDWLEGEQRDEYMEDVEDVVETVPELQRRLDQWLSTRTGFPEATIQFVNDMTSVIDSSVSSN